MTRKTLCRQIAGCLLAASVGLLADKVRADGSLQPMAIRLGSGEKSVERYKEYGYTGAILGDVTQLASYDEVCPGAIPQGSSLRGRIERQRKKFKKEYDRANGLGVAVCLLTDEVSFPAPILQLLQKSGASTGIDMENPEFWKLYRAKYREVLAAYPRVACVVVRTGENYSHPDEGFVGRTVYEGKYDDAYFSHMQRLIEETRKIVVDEFGRTLIWRTWDLGGGGFHAEPKVYDRVLQGLPNRKGLIFSIKHTQTDFWLYNDFNPMIGRGGTEQIVEFECAREYEGKGAFPDYVGPIHAEAMRKAHDIGVKGVWIWDFGGGWGGPFLKSDRWVRLNIEATTRLAQNPDLSPRALAQEWASNEFGAAAATNVAELAMLSGECVRKFIYVEAYGREHQGWKPSLNLMRDDIIRGEVLRQLYEGSKNSLPEVFAEKDQAVAMAGRMHSLFESSRSDIVAARGDGVYRESLSSLLYMESLSKVMCHYVKGMFSYYQWQETRDGATAAKARQELLAWSEAWQLYQTQVPKLPGAASLYRSQNTQSPDSANRAMADLCEAALRALPADTGHAAAFHETVPGAVEQGKN
jgi:hypothetical protein